MRREVPDWPNYAVDETGQAWSNLVPGTRGKRTGDWHLLKPVLRKGYLTLTLCGGGRRRLAGVHQLVLEAFVGPCPQGMECRHLDGNRTNNRLDNLTWGTRAANSQDTIHHGNHFFSVADHVGEANGNCKLSESKVLEIRSLAGTVTVDELARRFDVTTTTIRDIIRRKRWKHI